LELRTSQKGPQGSAFHSAYQSDSSDRDGLGCGSIRPRIDPRMNPYTYRHCSHRSNVEMNNSAASIVAPLSFRLSPSVEDKGLPIALTAKVLRANPVCTWRELVESCHSVGKGRKRRLGPKSIRNIVGVLRLIAGPKVWREWNLRFPGVPIKEQRFQPGRNAPHH